MNYIFSDTDPYQMALRQRAAAMGNLHYGLGCLGLSQPAMANSFPYHPRDDFEDRRIKAKHYASSVRARKPEMQVKRVTPA